MSYPGSGSNNAARSSLPNLTSMLRSSERMPAASSAFFSCSARIFSSMRAADDQLVDEDRLVLADAVGAVGGLVLDRRVPPRVVVDDGVGGGQVEADAAGLEADQEDRHLAGLEAADRRFAVARVCRSAARRRCRRAASSCSISAEHAGELREDEDAPAFVDQFGQHLHQQVELGAFRRPCAPWSP